MNPVNGLILALVFAVAVIVILAVIGWKGYKDEEERSKELDKREKELMKQDRTIALLRKFCFESTPVSVSTADLPEGITPKEAFAFMVPQYRQEDAGVEFDHQYGNSEVQEFRGFISTETISNLNVLFAKKDRLEREADAAASIFSFLDKVLVKAKAIC